MYRSGIPAGKGFETLFDMQAPSQVSGPPLDPAQRCVVEHPGGPLLVLAGPGTGKTHTLVEAVIRVALEVEARVIKLGPVISAGKP